MTCNSGKPFTLPDKTPKAITSKCKCPKDPKLNWVNLKKNSFKIYLADTSENVQKWTRVFSTRRWVILVARTRRRKEKKIARPLLDVFACGQLSSPRLYRLIWFFRSNEDVGGSAVKWAELSIRQIFLPFNVNLIQADRQLKVSRLPVTLQRLQSLLLQNLLLKANHLLLRTRFILINHDAWSSFTSDANSEFCWYCINDTRKN